MGSNGGVNPASRYFEAENNYGECSVCLCQWTDALEAFPCRHIYCAACVKGLMECPECCATIERLQEPNVALLELQKHSKGKCSACGWVGSYEAFVRDHKTCDAKVTSRVESVSVSSAAQSHVGSEYFLEVAETGRGNGAHQNKRCERKGERRPSRSAESTRRPTQQQQNQQQQQQQQQLGDRGWTLGFVPNMLRHDLSLCLPRERVEMWKQEISCTASEYGLSEEEFTFLKDNWVDFATLSPKSNNPELRWRDACRLLRYMNLPSHPNDVIALFRMAMQSTEDGSVPFHVVCLWIPLSRRDPRRWYGMDEKSYIPLLRYAQILDVEKTGLFNQDQCKGVGEQMLMREFTASEWQSILPLVFTRAQEFRASTPFYQSTVPKEQLVKLPLHEIILLYKKFFDPDKKSAKAREEVERKSSNYQQRIKRMLQYYNPAAMASIDSTLQELKGHEESLLMALVEDYGPEPL
ncbi:EF hand [Trypanosoma grayi]|uniref:EF hand n=1 Tax=Trypanosoma grayi TaxID=71804 RepID=UPI0004F40DF5|nr:EF hand [Trypanosoma grayi]KEG08081.1 EF hand [Trypanosoma grayi]